MSKLEKLSERILQLIAIVPLKAEGYLNLKKAVRQYLGLNENRTLYLDTKDEITLSTKSGRGKRLTVDTKNRIHLSEEVLKILKITKQMHVAFVERDNAIAIKAFQIQEKKGKYARYIDIETAYTIIRRIETNPMPDQFVPELVARYKNAKLKYSLKTFLKGRKTLEAWLARRILGISEVSDEALREQLIESRFKNQQENGSWQNHVPVTARNLRELADLGMTKKHKQIRKALDWLLDRPESKYNPGIWFATDELIREQAEVIKRRQKQKGKGPRERFNRRNASEVNLVRAGEPLATDPCGPRIMWTTALVIEALLKLGCEKLKRVQKALHTLTLMPMWCDNSYQHGLSEWKRTKLLSTKQIEGFTKCCIESFGYGGLCNPQELSKADASHQPFHFRRVAHNSYKGRNEYLINMPDAGEGCHIMMTRALSQVRDNRLRKILHAFLWRYAGLQNFQDGTFSSNPDRLFTDLQTVFLQIFSSNDHPVVKPVLLRAIPWIVNHQNKDGSWGTELVKDRTTYAVLCAMVSLGDDLPSGFLA